MMDTLTTRNGELVSAHIGPLHLDRTSQGVEMTLVGAVNPSAVLTDEQVRRLRQVLGTVR